MPSIVTAGIYHDATISHPERLVLELIMDDLDANAASVASSHTKLKSCSNSVISFSSDLGQTFSVKPKLVVNAAGRWIDKVNAALGAPSKMIVGTKGSHILMKHDELVQSLDSPADDPDTDRYESVEID